MKKKAKSKFILLLACLACLFLFGGCSIGETLDEALENRNLTAQVTYYVNDGTTTKRDIYYTDGSKALNIKNDTITNGKVEIENGSYEFRGWYYAVLDGEGKLVYEDADKKIYKLGEPVDFSVPLKSGDHWQVVAKWSARVALQVKLVLDDPTAQIPVDVAEGEPAKNYKNGDLVQTRQYGTDDRIVKPSGSAYEPFKKKGKGYTFVEYYADEACTEFVQWPIVKEEGQEQDAVIYAKYIEGNWSIIDSADDVTEMLSSFGSGKRFYFIKDIDATGVTFSPNVDGIFNDEIQGNGFSISNLTVRKNELKANNTVSLFGNIEGSAKIENLTMDGLTITYGFTSAPADAYFAFTSLAADATITNVRLSGTMQVREPSGSPVTTGLFGGYATDDEYLTESGGTGFILNGTKDELIEII